MVINDPFGSWVQGAHAGLEDATRLRQAQDQTAHANYGLQQAAQADPYRLNLLENEARASNRGNAIEQNLYNTGALQRSAEAKAALTQLQPGLHLAGYGLTGPLRSEIPTAIPGATNVSAVGDTPAGVRSMLPDASGGEYPFLDPGSNIMAPNMMHQQYQNYIAQIRAQHYQALEQQAQENAALRKQLAAPKLNAVSGSPSFLNGLNNAPAPPTPKANITTPNPYLPASQVPEQQPTPSFGY